MELDADRRRRRPSSGRSLLGGLEIDRPGARLGRLRWFDVGFGVGVGVGFVGISGPVARRGHHRPIDVLAVRVEVRVGLGLGLVLVLVLVLGRLAAAVDGARLLVGLGRIS